MLRRLDDSDVGRLVQGHRPFDEFREGHEIRIQDRHEIGTHVQRGQSLDRRVDIAGFGVAIVFARQIEATKRAAQRRDFRTAAIVKQPDPEIRIGLGESADNRALQDRRLLVIAADQYIDERRPRSVIMPALFPVGLLAPVARLHEQRHRQHAAQQGRRLDRKEDDGEHEFERQRKRRQGPEQAPPEIAGGQSDRDSDNDLAADARVATKPRQIKSRHDRDRRSGGDQSRRQHRIRRPKATSEQVSMASTPRVEHQPPGAADAASLVRRRGERDRNAERRLGERR